MSYLNNCIPMPRVVRFFLYMIVILYACGNPGSAEELPESEKQQVLQNDLYRTPRAGEAFESEVAGRQITVLPRDRRSVSSWDLGIDLIPGLHTADTPMGLLYFWRHPDEQTLLRAQISFVYNEFFRSQALPGLKYFEWVFTFENYTLPVAQAEIIDGNTIYSQELLTGYLRPGAGIGYRRHVSPGHQDNMFAIDLVLEPGYLYFKSGSKTAFNFIVPHDTFELRTHLQARWDAFERNLLELPHSGFGSGGDLIYGYRTQWRNWGVNGSEQDGRNYIFLSGYFLAAGGVPGVGSDRHRLIGSLHYGAGHNLDRFSAPRIGGGPDPMGEEYGSSPDPVLPGAALHEFFPRHYIVAVGEYRWEPVFFVYLAADASIAWLDRLRQTGSQTAWKNDLFTSLGLCLTAGFVYETRLQLAYNYNFSVVRDGQYGGQEIILNVTRNF